MHRRVAISFAEEIEKLSAVSATSLDRNIIPAIEARLKNAGMVASERVALLEVFRDNSMAALSASGPPGSPTYAAAQRNIRDMVGGFSTLSPIARTPAGAAVKWVDGKPVAVPRFSSSPVKLQPLKTNILGRPVLSGVPYAGLEDLLRTLGKGAIDPSKPGALRTQGEQILRERARTGARADLGSAWKSLRRESAGAPMRAVRAAEGPVAGGTTKAVNFITGLLRRLPR